MNKRTNHYYQNEFNNISFDAIVMVSSNTNKPLLKKAEKLSTIKTVQLENYFDVDMCKCLLDIKGIGCK